MSAFFRENKITTKDVDSEEEAKKEIARRIKMKMSKALKKTVEELTQLEEDKRLEAEKEKRVRLLLLLRKITIFFTYFSL